MTQLASKEFKSLVLKPEDRVQRLQILHLIQLREGKHEGQNLGNQLYVYLTKVTLILKPYPESNYPLQLGREICDI